MSSKRQKNKSSRYLLTKVISGGQTGADRAALEAALEAGIATGGWAPPGFVTSRGTDLVLRDRFHLVELLPKGGRFRSSVAAGYVQRSKANVDAADGTLAFRLHASMGTDKTIAYAQSGHWTTRNCGTTRTTTTLSLLPDDPYRPCLVVTSLAEKDLASNIETICQFILTHHITILNVCGHREAPPDCPNFSETIQGLLTKCFSALCTELQ